ncbi:MAG: hypothetical protein IT534_14725 [Bauldia sp.]|nr:hypothetical protein [Bauldia sp.]
MNRFWLGVVVVLAAGLSYWGMARLTDRMVDTTAITIVAVLAVVFVAIGIFFRDGANRHKL